MEILDKKVSYFLHSSSTECMIEDRTIGSFLKGFKDGEFKDIVDKVRSSESKEQGGYWKTKLTTIGFHGVFDGFRKKDLFVESTGLIILDIDDIEDDLEEVKSDIMDSYDSVFSVFVSPSGNGLKVLYYITPELVNSNNYRQIGKQIVSNFDIYGKVDFLSITDTLIATYDPKIRINKDVIPDFVYVKEYEKVDVELEPLDEKVPLWDNVEDFFDTVLANDIAQKTNNNYHYIQVSILDLAKFGFKHPEHDLSFVIDYAENEFKYSSENKNRFKEVVEISKNYSQTKWAYKLIKSDDPNDDYIDYSEFKEKPKKTNTKDSIVEGEDDEEEDYFVNHELLFDKVISTIEEGNRVGFEVSYEDIADIIRFKGHGIFTFTGIPTHGKSEMLDAITLDLARLYGHQTLVAGFEQTPEEHLVKLLRKMEGKDIRCTTWRGNEDNLKKLNKMYRFLTSKIVHLDTDKTGGNINLILESFAKKIKKLRESGGNVKYVVIDPFNLLSIKGSFSGHEKIEEILRRLTHFSKQMEVLVFLVAHPFKMKKDDKTGVYEVPDFYSVKGSSAFFEMSYHGAVVYRNGLIAMLKILKVKQNNLGEKDECAYFLYDRGSGRYIPCDEEGNEKRGTHRDKDWFKKALELESNNYNNK